MIAFIVLLITFIIVALLIIIGYLWKVITDDSMQIDIPWLIQLIIPLGFLVCVVVLAINYSY